MPLHNERLARQIRLVCRKCMRKSVEKKPLPHVFQVADRKPLHFGKFHRKILAQLRKESITPEDRFLLFNDIGSQLPIKLEHFAIDSDGSLNLDGTEVILKLRKPIPIVGISFYIHIRIILHKPSNYSFIIFLFAPLQFLYSSGLF